MSDPVNSSDEDEAARQECVILTERCTDRHCGRLRYGELTDDLNTHWHVKRGACLVPLAAVRADCEAEMESRVAQAVADTQRQIESAVSDERRRIEEALELLRELIDPDVCWFDHHGYCQAHGWLTNDGQCPHARAKQLLAAGSVPGINQNQDSGDGIATPPVEPSQPVTCEHGKRRAHRRRASQSGFLNCPGPVSLKESSE